MAGTRWPVSRTNRGYSACVTGWTARKKSSSVDPVRRAVRPRLRLLSPSGSPGRDQRKFGQRVNWHERGAGANRIAQVVGGDRRRLRLAAFRYTFGCMKLEPFAMERLQSTWENRVAWNLSESGVHPLRLEELADTNADRAALFGQELGYPQTNGTRRAARGDRGAVSGRGPGSHRGHQRRLGSQLRRALAPRRAGDEVVMMMPNYMQMRGIARGARRDRAPWPLAWRHEARLAPRSRRRSKRW